jgi:hypothetical protein
MTVNPDRVHALVEAHLDNLIADVQKELAVETGAVMSRLFSGPKREALITIISADMQRFALGDARPPNAGARRR